MPSASKLCNFIWPRITIANYYKIILAKATVNMHD